MSKGTVGLYGVDGKRSELKPNEIVAIDSACERVLFASPPTEPGKLPGLKTLPLQSRPPDSVSFGLSDSLKALVKSSNETKAKVTVIISVLSGSQQAQECYERLIEPFLAFAGFDSKVVDVQKTASANSIVEYTRKVILPRAQSGQTQLILMLSGDGGLIDVLDTLYIHDSEEYGYRKPVIALFPCGTGNALANSAKICSDATFGLSALARGSPKPLPVFKVKLPPGSIAVGDQQQALEAPVTVYGAVVFSWALHSTLVADSDTPEYRKFGADRFQMAGKELLFPSDGSAAHAFKGLLSYKSPGNDSFTAVERTAHAYLLLAMVSHMEATFCISPDSRPLDGIPRLVHLDTMAKGGEDIMNVMMAAYDGGKHVQDQRVGYEPVEAITVRIDEDEAKWRRVCVDGKIFVVPKGGNVTVERDMRDLVDLMVDL